MEKGNADMNPISRKPRTKKKGIEPIWLWNYPDITRGQAVKVFCRECMGYTKHRENKGISETWAVAGKMVRGCTDTGCPLFRFRPGVRRSSGTRKSDSTAIQTN